MRTQIVFEDSDVLVVLKPAGLATQTAQVGRQDVVSELKNYLSQGSGAPPYLGVVHRLDQPVEGLLVFGKNKRAAAALAAGMARGDTAGGEALHKRYYGIFCGKKDKREGQLTDYLYRDASGRATVWESGTEREAETGQKAEAEREALRAKKAVLYYHVLQETEVMGIPLSLVDIRIETGRFHQIRAQMAHGGMCLLGDAKYGDADTVAAAKSLNVTSVSLCAYELKFLHPVTGKELSFRMTPQGKAFSYFQL